MTVVSHICGGLGNQMFQYAAGRRLAARRGAALRLDLSDYRTGADDRGPAFAGYRRPVRLYELRVTAPAADDAQTTALADRYRTASTRDRLVRQLRKVVGRGFLWPASHVLERNFRFDPAVLNLTGDVYLQGFWQSWRYFADEADLIRAEFRPKDATIALDASAFVGHLRSLGGPVVSLHVRRGDLAHATETLRDPKLVYGPPVGLTYLAAAARRFGPDARFLVFSDSADDIAWCRANLPAAVPDPTRLHYSDGCSDLADMARMSACDGHVIANSTFSWWAAWLADRPGKRVVAPRRWGHPTSGMVTDDLIPPAWEQV